MIPIRDTEPSLTKPVVVKILIALNIAVFAYELSLGRQLTAFFGRYGLVPARYFALEGAGPGAIFGRIYPVFTSMFLHGGWLHIGFNMLFLWIFGDNIEDRLGRLRFVLFYLFCGAAGAYAQLYLNPQSTAPMVGASGAIAGVMGGYIMLFPKSRVLALVPIFYFVQIVELPAFLFLGLWFMLQFVSGAVAVLAVSGQSGGTAWWAHIGGFAAGFVLVRLVQKRGARRARRQRNFGGRRYGKAVDQTAGGEPWLF